MPKQFTSWSFSRYSDYRSCPAKAKYKHLDRLPEPKSEALAKGIAVHEKAEHYISRGLARLPKELKRFDDTFKRLKKKRKEQPNYVLVEAQWAFTKDWRATRWDDWGGCACRIKTDCVEMCDENVIRVYDWKTGKYRVEKNQEYLEQLDLYALGALSLFPKAVVIPKLIYLDTGDVHPTIDVKHTSVDIDILKKKWGERIAPMLNDTVFSPSPSYSCRWCAYRKEVGGPCQF